MVHFSRRLALKSALVCALVSLFFNTAAAADAVLRVSAIPDEAPTELQRKFAPLGKYLEKELGMKVSFVPVSDYAAVVEALASDKLDLAWLGGFTFVQANIRTKGTALPIVQREEDARFTSKFITADPNIKTLADTRGKVFAFGSPSSTSGHLMPRYFLMQDGINADSDFKNVAFSGAHDATVAFVASGKADAGVLNASVWAKLVEQQKVDAKVRVIATTPPYFDYNWTVRGDLDPALIRKIEAAFLKLDASNPEHAEILALQRATKFIPTKKENYAGIEQAAKAAGLLK
ncbi:MAG: Phosphate-import protein PhnD precursor [Candidatus Accumulibacter regalis]|jgi:phosphonate transport system substrate-binding protein|uniref:Phosphate-import protein PhnD n=1 Tax=Accumulibacter regalis TaxID=522306 RepID=A0A011Q888_ACCRE|nr:MULTISPECIES: putative selenate ABC transporter substrate-binding protein [unclassified Candidatus Accumulibacter]EXI85432.1 MAG: Phosphate-import protein PhnD precursor [Candidatus Accumulibacter regalis]MQM33482.1 putative selenate ABC transporter substrate-binding protein [Candidatus Accumulibacter phosphatis]MBL8368203.1 putative selenate ABC transporter substrate-binding protein [Accumulibacter sp.]MBN8514741.1 putative selenate ABC transporter substrate-binding protein [Accumulibacter 